MVKGVVMVQSRLGCMLLTLDLLGGLVAAVKNGTLPLDLEVTSEQVLVSRACRMARGRIWRGIGVNSPKLRGPLAELREAGGGFHYLRLRHDG